MAKKKLEEVQQVETVNLVECASQSLSKDKQHILLVFHVGDPNDEKTWRKLGVTLPAVQARWLVGVAFAALTMVEKAGKNPGNSVLHFPLTYSIADHPELDKAEFTLSDGTTKFPANKGKTVIGFDQGKPTEMNFVMMNAPAMMLAEAIRQKVAPRLTEQDKADLRPHNIKVA